MSLVPQDTGKTIVSEELKNVLGDDPFEDANIRLPSLKVVVKYKGISVELQCEVMMIDEWSAALTNFPINDAFDTFGAKQEGFLESVTLKLPAFDFVFDAPDVSLSVTDSTTCLVSLSRPRSE